MTDISQAQIEQAIKTTAATVLRNEAYFSDLDGLAGDGDFGTSLATGFRVIDAELPGIDKSSIGAMLLKISMLVSKHVGGSSGPIWGTGFMKAALLSKGKESVTLAELSYGVEKSAARTRNRDALAAFTARLDVVDFDSAAATAYGVVRARLEQAGGVIGPYDMMIAGHALSRQSTVVTNNRREFDRVAGLPVEDWSR